MKFPEEIEVNVTQDNIDKGRANNCRDCAVARALWNNFPKADNIHVTQQIIIEQEFVRAEYILPLEVIIFMNKFDGGELVKPFSFKTIINAVESF